MGTIQASSTVYLLDPNIKSTLLCDAVSSYKANYVLEEELLRSDYGQSSSSAVDATAHNHDIPLRIDKSLFLEAGRLRPRKTFYLHVYFGKSPACVILAER